MQDWGLRCPKEQIVEAFFIWLDTQYQVLPYAGGWWDQPLNVQHDFRMLLDVYSYHARYEKSDRDNGAPA